MRIDETETQGDFLGAKYTEAQNKATQKYIKAAYDTISLRVPKGKREYYKNTVQTMGYDSLNSFIVKAIDEKIDRESN